MEDDAQQRVVYMDLAAVVADEAEFAEFVHEKIHAGAGGADHLRQSLLGNFGQCLFRIAWGPIAREEQQSAGQALFAGVEELVDEVLFDADIARQHVGDEAVGE